MGQLKHFEVTIKQCLPRVFKTVVLAEDDKQARRRAHLIADATAWLGDWELDIDKIQPDGSWHDLEPMVGLVVKVEQLERPED